MFEALRYFIFKQPPWFKQYLGDYSRGYGYYCNSSKDDPTWIQNGYGWFLPGDWTPLPFLGTDVPTVSFCSKDGAVPGYSSWISVLRPSVGVATNQSAVLELL
jgi:hypothetical protein